jgi:ABC-type lipoprotein export system ATPase subunit
MSHASQTRPIIQATALTRIYAFGATRVVGIERVDISIAAGEMVVLKGNSGSGKSTLLSLLAGLDRPTGGELIIADHDLNRSNERRLTGFRRKVVGMVFQSFNLLPTLSVMENTCLPALLMGQPLNATRQKAEGLLKLTNMAHRHHHLPSQLSGGEMQRTAIARALINEPAIILADEPTGNLDSRNGAAVIELLADLNRRLGRTVVIATHSDLADRYATRMVELKDGSVVGRC